MSSSAQEATRALRFNYAAARSFPKPLFTIDSESFTLMGFNVMKRQGVVQYVTTVAARVPARQGHGEPSAWVTTYSDAQAARNEWQTVAFEFFHGIAINSSQTIESHQGAEFPPLPETRAMSLRVENTDVVGEGFSIKDASAVLLRFEDTNISVVGADSSLSHGIARLNLRGL